MKIHIPTYYWGYLLLLLIVIGGVTLRFYEIGYQSYWIDEGFTLMQAESISQHGYPLLASGAIEKKDIFLPYILSLFVKAYSLDTEYLYRSIGAAFGSFAILLAFFLGRSLWDWRAGVLYSFLIAFSNWHVVWSRQVRGYEIMIFFILLTMFFMAKFEKDPKNIYVGGVLLSVILAAISKSFGILFFPVVITYFFLKKKYILASVLCVLGSVIAIVYRHLFLQAVSSEHPNYFLEYVFGYLFDYYGLFFICALVGFVLALYEDRDRRIFHGAIVLFVGISLIFFSSFVYVAEYRYMFMLSIWIFLYASYFGFFLVSHMRSHALIFVIILFVAMNFFGWRNEVLTFIPKKEYALEGFTPQPDFKKMYRNLDLRDEDVIISTYPYMDIIYLNRADYALPISYTGRNTDTSMRGKLEYYSGTRSIYDLNNNSLEERIEKVRDEGDVYLIVDSFAMRRASEELNEYLSKRSERLYRVMSSVNDQEVYVYKVAK